MEPGPDLAPVLRADAVALAAVAVHRPVEPVARVPRADATPEVARVVDAIGPVPVIAEPPHPALVASPQPSAEHIRCGGCRVPVPREDACLALVPPPAGKGCLCGRGGISIPGQRKQFPATVPLLGWWLKSL